MAAPMPQVHCADWTRAEHSNDGQSRAIAAHAMATPIRPSIAPPARLLGDRGPDTQGPSGACLGRRREQTRRYTAQPVQITSAANHSRHPTASAPPSKSGASLLQLRSGHQSKPQSALPSAVSTAPSTGMSTSNASARGYLGRFMPHVVQRSTRVRRVPGGACQGCRRGCGVRGHAAHTLPRITIHERTQRPAGTSAARLSRRIHLGEGLRTAAAAHKAVATGVYSAT